MATKLTTPGKCACGCKATVERFYKPGHDQRHFGQIARAIVANPAKLDQLLATLPSDALRAKARQSAERLAAQALAKTERKLAKVDAKLADLTDPAHNCIEEG